MQYEKYSRLVVEIYIKNKMEANYKNIILLIVITLIIYANSINNSFVWDDIHLIVKNTYIKNWIYIPQIFSSDIFHIYDAKETVINYRPLQSLSFMWDYFLWHLNSIGYHITNIFLHILNVILVYFLTCTIVREKKISLFTGLFFAVHPIHTEAVTYISGRADLLVTFFLLLSLLLFIKHINYLELKRIYLYLASVIFFILALFSKEIAIIFPFCLIIYNFIFHNRIAKKMKYRYLPFLVIAIIYCLVRIPALGITKQKAADINSTLWPRIFTFPKVIIQYIKLLFVPLNLHMEREVMFINSPFEPVFLISCGLLCFIAWLIIKTYRYSQPVFFGLIWLFLNLLAVSNIFPLNAPMAEHWLYLPSIGFFMAVSVSVFKMSSFPKRNATIIISLILLTLSTLTIKQNTYWKDGLTLYQRILRFNPNSDRAHTNLGIFYMKQGLKEKAMSEFKKSINLNPANFIAYTSLGNLYSRNELYDEAMAAYKTSLELNPRYGGIHVNIGAVLYKQGLYEEAINEFNKALKINAYDAEARNNLGVVYLSMGLDEKALLEFKKSLNLNPDNIDVYNNLIDYYEKHGVLLEAVDTYKKVLVLNPDDTITHNKLIAVYEKKGEYNKVIEECKKIIKREPNNIKIFNLLAITYEKKGMYNQALIEFSKAIKIAPDNPDTYNNLGIFYAKFQQFQQARQVWEKALEIDPDYEAAKKNLSKLKSLGF